MTDPLVSVVTTAYNHEKFIAQAIEGFLIQKTSFPFEVLINDDASTDGTAAIVRKYEAAHPEIIKGFYQTENQFSKGKNTFLFLLGMAKGKYIAICEGDDYWMDPHKLQKQVDFLDSHPKFTICFHNVNVIYEDGTKEPHLFHRQQLKATFTLEDVLSDFFIPTCSTMFRAGLFHKLPGLFYTVTMGDWILHILNTQHGDAGYLNEVLGTYRIHSGGVWSSKSRVDVLKGTIYAAEKVNRYLNFRYNKIIKANIAGFHREAMRILIRENDFENARYHAKECLLALPFHDYSSRKLLVKVMLRGYFPHIYGLLKSYKTMFYSNNESQKLNMVGVEQARCPQCTDKDHLSH